MGGEARVLLLRVADLPHCSRIPILHSRAGRAGWGGAIVQNKANLSGVPMKDKFLVAQGL